MKRLAVFILLILLLCGVDYFLKKDWKINSFFFDSDLEVYLSSIEELDNEFFLSNENYIKNGEGLIVYCKYNDLKKYLNLKHITGFTIRVYNFNEGEVLRGLNPIQTKKVLDYTYGYTSKINRFDSVNGNNFQMAVKEDFILVGFPILLGSY